LTVNIFIAKEFIQNKRHIIIKNSNKKEKFTSNLIKSFKSIDILFIFDKDSLKLIVQEYARILDLT